MLKTLYNILIKPKSDDEDSRRREFILNVLLLGAITLAAVAFLIDAIAAVMMGANYTGTSPVLMLIPVLLFVTLLALSRNKFHHFAAYFFVSLLYVLGTYPLYTWGIALAGGLLVYVLVIVMAGVLLGSKQAFISATVTSLTLLLLSHLQAVHYIKPDLFWVQDTGKVSDATVYVCMFLVITMVSWLSNREIERSLKRARKSEASLKQERDLLEVKVEERTRELKQAQLEKMLQLYRFAEFGRLSAGLLHDLANPLTAVSLNLEQLSAKESSALLNRAIKATRHVESFVKAARKQVQDQDELQLFSVGDELGQAIRILEHRAKEVRATIKLEKGPKVEIYGNPLKFHQLIGNILANAVDAYENCDSVKRQITVNLGMSKHLCTLSIHDWGKGIPKDNLEQIFEPLFTTKDMERGTGIGLSITKNIVENDFFGTIKVRSGVRSGTVFAVSIPVQHEVN